MSTIEGGIQRSGFAYTRLKFTVRTAATDPTAAPSLGQTTASGGRDQAFRSFSNAILAALQKRVAAAAAPQPAADKPATLDLASVAGALRDALASGTGDDPVAGVLSDIERALETASDGLRATGVSEADVRSYVADFKQQLGDKLDALSAQIRAGAAPVTTPPATTTPGTSAGNATGSTTDPTAATDPAAVAVPSVPVPTTAQPASVSPTYADARYRLTQSAGIKLVTQDGDVVRIRARYSEGFAAKGGSDASGAYASVSSFKSARFSIDVKGSLSDAEKQAISDVLGQVDQVAQKFFVGDVSDAFAAGAAIGFDARQLAGFSLKLSQTESLRLTSAGAPPPTPLPAPPTPATPGASTPVSTNPASTPPVSTTPGATTEPVPVDPGTDSTPATGTATDAAAAPASTDPAATADPTPTSPAAARSTITDYLRGLFAALGTTTTAGRITITAYEKLQLVVAAVDANRIASRPAEASATGLLGNVVGQLTDANAPKAPPKA